MNKYTIAMATLMAALMTSGAQAATFTWTSTTDGTPTVLGVNGPDGTGFNGVMWKGKSEAMMDGKKQLNTFTCISMNQPENDSIFASHVVCDTTSSDGTWSMIGGCTVQDKDKQINSCVAGLYGKTGAYAGKKGNLTSYGGIFGASGTGQWFD